MIALLIALLLPFTIHAGHSAVMHEDNEFAETADLVKLFNTVRRGEDKSDKHLRECAANMPLETLEVMSAACNYAVKERQKMLLHDDNREAQSLLELRALACDLKNRHYNEQQVAQQNQRKRIENITGIGMSVAGIGAAFTAAASYLCCGVINAQTLVGAGMIGAGCGCLCCIGAIGDSLCDKHNPTPIEQDLATELEKARVLVVIKEAVQKAADAGLKREWQESLQTKKTE